METQIIPADLVARKICLVRGHKVMLDRDLAELYGVETRALNQAVRRNIERFPEDFMFSLTREEIMRISQIVISSAPDERGDLKYSKSVLAIEQRSSEVWNLLGEVKTEWSIVPLGAS